MIRQKRHVYLVAFAITLLTTSVVAVQILVMEPPAQWRRELTIGSTMAVILTFPISLFLCEMILQNHRLSVELRRLLERDRLSGVATRDYFFSFFEARPEVQGTTLMVDIDQFKRINDAHGHLVGDRVIRTIAETICETVRPGDIVCRFGGEEFVVFLRDADGDAGAQIAERTRLNIEQGAVRIGQLTVQTTVSIGGALKQAGEEVDSAILKADEALYRAKSNGRNRVEMEYSNSRRRISGMDAVAG